MPSAFTLAFGAKKRGTLRLDDAFNGSRATSRARFFCLAIDPMTILVAADLVEGVAVRSVRERGPFVLNCLLEYIAQGLMNAPPLLPGDTITPFFGMNAGDVKQFRSVEIPNSRERFLV